VEINLPEIIAEAFVILHAIEQRLLRGQRRIDGVGRLKFDFHTGGAEKMLRFFRPWGNKDHDAAPAQTRPGRAAFRQSPRAQGFGGGRGDDGDY
jgi:hypothetical protein